MKTKEKKEQVIYWLLYMLIFIIVIPSVTEKIVNLLQDSWKLIIGYNAGTFADWLNFYGQIVGAVVSVAISLFVLMQSLRNNRELQAKEQIFRFDMERVKELRENLASFVYIQEILRVYKEYLGSIGKVVGNRLQTINLDNPYYTSDSEKQQLKSIYSSILQLTKPRLVPASDDIRLLRKVESADLQTSLISALTYIRSFYEIFEDCDPTNEYRVKRNMVFISNLLGTAKERNINLALDSTARTINSLQKEIDALINKHSSPSISKN